MSRIAVYGLTVVLLLANGGVYAWGREAHRSIGALAVEAMDSGAKQKLYTLLGTANSDTIVDWCIWPDAFRATNEGAWTAPLHFVNIPEGAGKYLASRDCENDLCVTKAIPRYALELADSSLSQQQRVEAFAFVCHFVGDLSQPLHAGFGSDRGGNNVQVFLHGEQMSLHGFWDWGLINTKFAEWQPLYRLLRNKFQFSPRKTFLEEMAVRWTNHSHRLAATRAYPAGSIINQPFEDEAWSLMQQQMVLGARNLATVLNAALRDTAGSQEGQQ